MADCVDVAAEDAVARRIYERVRPSLVDVSVTRASDGVEFRTLAAHQRC